MNTIRRIFRHATRLGIAAAALIAGIVAAPAAFATEVPPTGTGDTGTTTFTPPAVHTVTVGGTPGWQIALFIVAAAVIAAVAAVLLDRTRTGRRHELAPTAH
jgi:ABC-type branched-subunit amino acid transport system permease subunit